MEEKNQKKQQKGSSTNIQNVLGLITVTGKYSIVAQLGALLLGSYFISLYSYLLFHTLAEMISVVIAFSVFVVAWNSRKYVANNYFLVVGIALASAGVIDMLHMLAYKGMGVFVEYTSANLPTQLWLAARYITSISLLVALLFLKKKVAPKRTLAIYGGVTVALLLFIFYFKIFPTAFVEGVGITPFKRVSEYIISAFLIGSLVGLYRKRRMFYKRVYYLLAASIVAMVLSELMFTLYGTVTDNLNMAGHLFKIAAFYWEYLAIVEMGILKPYRTLFKDLKDSEVALKESEERHRSLIEHSPSGILVHRDGIIQYVNPEAVKIFAANKKEDLIGRNIMDFILPEFRSDVQERTRQIQSGIGSIESKEMKLTRLDGQVIDIGSSAILAEYQGKEVVQATIKDITQKKKTENALKVYMNKLERTTEDLKKFRMAVSGASDHIVITDIDGHILYANNAVEKITGHAIQEILGKRSSLWGGQMPKEFYDKFWQTIKEEKTPYSGEVVNIRKNGEKYIAYIEVAPIFDDEENLYGFIGIERDITKTKEIDRAKTEFVSLASHQLRTPLSSISLSAELLLRGISGEVDGKQRRLLEEIQVSAKRMTELISALLNVSRIELGTFKVQPELISITENIDQITDELIREARIKKIAVEKKYDEQVPLCVFDKNIFRMMFENIFTNAIKYTPEKGKVAIQVKKNGDEILITVTDTGCGIPEGQQGEVFSKLFRADNAREITTEGAGLGLYIAKSVAEKTGVNLWFKSEENYGTTFFLAIPIKTTETT